MNELIKELEKQAESFAETAYNKQTMATFHTNKSAEEIFREKFAELIVRECASIAGKAEYSDTWTEPVEDTIKKHFGVQNESTGRMG